MTIRLYPRMLLAIGVAVGALLLSSPGTARAQGDDFYGVQLRYAGEFSGFRIAAATSGPDTLNFTSALGDLHISSLTGIRDPLPTFCIRAGLNLVRCPLNGLTEVESYLGPGNDIWGVGIVQSIDAAALQTFIAYLGAGHDRATGGIVSNEIHGQGGPDDITGGPRRDFLFGDARNDFLVGLEGNDQFRCGKGGRDRFSDGPGRDRVNIAECEFRIKF